MKALDVQPRQDSRRHRGFTLVESVMVLGVISVLATVAIRTYGDAALKARRAEGILAVSTLAGQQHRYFVECNRYAQTLASDDSCEAGTLRSPARSAGGHYDLALRVTDGGFEAEAMAVEGTSQARDGHCTKLTLRYTGNDVQREPAGCF